MIQTQEIIHRARGGYLGGFRSATQRFTMRGFIWLVALGFNSCVRAERRLLQATCVANQFSNAGMCYDCPNGSTSLNGSSSYSSCQCESPKYLEAYNVLYGLSGYRGVDSYNYGSQPRLFILRNTIWPQYSPLIGTTIKSWTVTTNRACIMQPFWTLAGNHDWPALGDPVVYYPWGLTEEAEIPSAGTYTIPWVSPATPSGRGGSTLNSNDMINLGWFSIYGSNCVSSNFYAGGSQMLSTFSATGMPAWWGGYNNEGYNGGYGGQRGDFSIRLNYAATGAPTVMRCVSCPQNHYRFSNTRCIVCPDNSMAAAGVATSVTDCTCPIGLYLKNGTTCARRDSIVVVYDMQNASESLTGQAVSVGIGNISSVVLDVLSDITVTAEMCQAGTFAREDSQFCFACQAGTYRESIGGTQITDCLECGAGKYSSVLAASSSSVCLLCPANSYYAGTGGASLAVCQACPQNSWSFNGSQALTSCICQGGYSGPNGGPCLNCDGSVYCVNGQANPCPSHSTAPQGSSSIQDCMCDPGYYGDTSMGGPGYPVLCQACKEGNWCPGGSENASNICPDGKYSLAGSDDIGDCRCPDNAISVRKSSNISQCSCNPGYYKVSNASAPLGGWNCLICQPNQFCFNDLNQSCPAHSTSLMVATSFMDCTCSPGYANSTNPSQDSLCVDCPNNAYCTGGGASEQCVVNAVSPAQSPNSRSCFCDWGYKGVNNSECIACDTPHFCYGGIEATCSEGTFSSPFSWGSQNCSCLPGRFGKAGGPCLACIAGKYKPLPGCITCTNTTDTDCVACTAGTYSTMLERNTSCDMCGAGTFSPTGASACQTCGNGTYSLDQAGACTVCNLGWYALANSSACTACPVNTFLDTGGKGSVQDCEPCPDGTVSSKLGNTDPGCSACPPGTFQSNGTCVACLVGTYSRSGSIKCRDCIPGTYSTGNATTCQECARGTISSGNASGYCVPCLAGTFSPFAGESVCGKCPIGSISAITGGWNCSLCADGTYAAAGDSQCTACAAGTWGAGRLESAGNCSGCSMGRYSTTLGGTGPSVCIACAAGKYSNITKAPEVSQLRGKRVHSFPLHVLCFSATHSTPS